MQLWDPPPKNPFGLNALSADASRQWVTISLSPSLAAPMCQSSLWQVEYQAPPTIEVSEFRG